jgi:hypothetical protein
MMNYQHLTSDICRIVNENNQWSSTIVIPQGDGFLVISSTLMGNFSATPVGATNQPTVYPSGKAASFYRFDPDLYPIPRRAIVANTEGDAYKRCLCQWM